MWQTTHIAGWGYDDTEDENLIKVDQDVPEEKSERILFKGDGTYKMVLVFGKLWMAIFKLYRISMKLLVAK